MLKSVAAGSRGKTCVISVDANCTVSLTVAQLPVHSPPRLSLRRLRLANCKELGGPALASLIGHAELEALDLSHSTHVLTETSIASLQKLESKFKACYRALQLIAISLYCCSHRFRQGWETSYCSSSSHFMLRLLSATSSFMARSVTDTCPADCLRSPGLEC